MASPHDPRHRRHANTHRSVGTTHLELLSQSLFNGDLYGRKLAADLRKALDSVPISSEEIRTLDTTTNPHTNLDQEIGKFLATHLADILPHLPIVSEEDEFTDPPKSGNYWLVDPLDGTLNTVRGEGAVAISVALFEVHQCIAGAVRRLDSNDIVVAVLDKLNPDTRDQVTRSTRPTNLTFVSFGMPSRPSSDVANMTRPVRACWERDWITRQSGSAASDILAVAAGTLDGFFQQGVEPWDVAAADLIARVSGCVSWSQRRKTQYKGIGSIDYAIAATPEMLAAIVSSIRGEQ